MNGAKGREGSGVGRRGWGVGGAKRLGEGRGGEGGSKRLAFTSWLRIAFDNSVLLVL